MLRDTLWVKDSPTIGDIVRLVIADDHDVVRTSLVRALDRIHGIDVVGAADGPAALVELLDEARPDAVLLDLRFGDESGLELAGELVRRSRPPAVLLFSAHLDDRTLDLAAELGISALTKGVPLDEIVEAVVAAVRAHSPPADQPRTSSPASSPASRQSARSWKNAIGPLP